MKRVETFVLIFILFGASSPVYAAGETSRVVNFAILAAVLYFAIRKPLGDYLSARAEQIRTELAEAADNHARASAETEKAEERLARLDEEIAKVRADAERTAEAERNRILESARAEAARIEEIATKQIDAQVEAGRRKLLARATELSVELAEKKIKTSINDDDHNRLVDRSIELLGERS